jgi:phosphoadenosine phosphosulfate reductase
MLGGSHHGQRLNTLYRENIDEAILAALDPLLARYADERLAAEPSATCTAPASSPCRRTPPTPASIWNWRMNAPDPPFVPDPAVADAATLARINTWLEARDADARVQWALDTRPARMLSTSFAQAAVSLHLLTAHKPGIPVILIDTGYLFAETYRFADQLIERFDLNLKIFRPTISRAWMEARHGELWNDGRAGIERYNALRKVEPMKRALAELGVRTWFAGLRRNQSEPGRHADPARAKDAGFHPLADWSDRDVWQYMKKHDLPYNPLWHEGYVSIGDYHTTARWSRACATRTRAFWPQARVRAARLTVVTACAAAGRRDASRPPIGTAQ